MVISCIKHFLNTIVLLAMFTIQPYASIMIVDPYKSVDKKQFMCLAKNIFFEARNQSDNGKIAVAYVTLNRVNSKYYPNTICGVVWQKHQFSWTSDGKSDNPDNYNDIGDVIEWNKSLLLAYFVMMTYVSDPTLGADHYHAVYVSPPWARQSKKTVKVGDHIFYKLNK